MSDDATTGPWVFDPETLHQLRLQKAQQALAGQEPHRALVEAEELLEDDPHNLEALTIVGRAALEMGDAFLAVQAFEHLVGADPDVLEPRIGLAAARFQAVDLEGSLEVARALTQAVPGRPEGWYYAALCLERLGEREEARVAFERAHACSPEAYPLPARIGARTWTQVLREALAQLPGPFRAFYSAVPFKWEDLPEVSRLKALDPPLPPFLAVLLEGSPPIEGDPWVQRPRAAWLYRTNLAWPPAPPAELSWRLQRALLVEAMQWLGLEDTEGLLEEEDG